MKRYLLLKVINNLKQKPHLMRKLKIFIVLIFISITVLGSFGIWLAYKATNYVTLKTSEIISSQLNQSQVDQVKTQLKEFTQLQAVSCWAQAQNLMNITAWLSKPAVENLFSLRDACFNKIAPDCAGKDCLKPTTSI